MKVLLINDVSGLGQRGDIVTVRDGYARNLLIPEGAARPADERAVADALAAREAARVRKTRKKEELWEYRKNLEGMLLSLKRKANEHGHLFAGVRAKDIAELLHKKGFLQILPEHIEGTPLKFAGRHEIGIRIGDKRIALGVTIDSL